MISGPAALRLVKSAQPWTSRADKNKLVMGETLRLNTLVLLQGKPYRYAYSVSAQLPASYGNALAKFDIEAGTSQTWHQAGAIPMEPIMVPRPGSQVGRLVALACSEQGWSLCMPREKRSCVR